MPVQPLVQQVYADPGPTTISVSPSSIVNTALTPESPGVPYSTTLKADGDGSYLNWTGNRALRPTADGTFTDWSGAFGDWDDWPTHNGDTDKVSVSADAQHETSELEDHSTADDTWDIGKVRVVAYARNQGATDETLVLTLGVPSVGSYDSYGGSNTASGGVNNPGFAHDGNLATYADFQSGSTDYLYVHTFSIAGAPTGSPISSVDFKMKWSESGGGADKQYRILYKVSPSTTEVVLIDWTGADADHTTTPQVWATMSDPNGDGWQWTDMAGIQFMVEARSAGGGGKGLIMEYEAWVTVNYAGTASRYEGESHSLTSTYQKYTSEWPWNPATGSAWTWSDIDMLEAGVTSRQVGGSWTGEIRVTQLYVEVVGGTSLRPNGDGTYTDWTGTPTDTYQDWDEPSFHNGDTDYVYADSIVGDYAFESSTLQNHARGETWDIAMVRVVIYARTNVATDEKVALMLYDTGWAYGEDVGDSFSLTTTYEKYTWEWTERPDTMNPWTWSDIDSLEAGVISEAVGGWTGEIRITQLYVEIIGATGNYKAWDEYPNHNSDLDYVSAEAQSLVQTSTLENSTLTWGIARVRLTVVALVTEVDAQPEKIAPTIVTGGKKYEGTEYALTTNYTSYTCEWGLNPYTGSLWTWAEINATEIGVASAMGGLTWTGEVRVTQIYVEVSGPGFKVDIEVDTVTDLWLYVFEMFYDPEIIHGVWAEPASPHRNGTFLSSAGGTVNKNPGSGYDDTIGWLSITGAYLSEVDPSKCPDGGGVLATVVFEVIRQGNSSLRLGKETGLMDPYGAWIVQGRDYVADGSFRNVDSNLIPAADFSYAAVSPAPEPLEGYNVTFTNTSTPASGRTIDACKWYFWKKGSYHRELDSPIITSESIVTHNYTIRGTYNMTLTVFDSDGVVGTKTKYIIIKAHDIFFSAITTNSTKSFLPPYAEGYTAIDKLLNITVTVVNEGDFTETPYFNVSLFWSAVYAGKEHFGSINQSIEQPTIVANLAAGASKNLTFYWDTTGHSLTHPNRYQFHANASRVQYEYDVEWDPTKIDDNEFTTSAPRIGFHDMAVTQVSTNATQQTILPGVKVEVTVTVWNQGDFNETNLVVKSWVQKESESPININTKTFQLMTNKSFSDKYIKIKYPFLENETATFKFLWDTTGRSGKYTIWTNVTQVPNDYEPTDNTFTNGWTQVSPAVPEFPLGAAVEIALATVIVYVWWKGRHKTKHPKPSKFLPVKNKST